MGAWGYTIFENDAAQEVLDRWDEWNNGPHAMGYEQALEHYFKYWGDAIEYGDSITNCEIIALVGIHLEKEIEIPKKLFEAAVKAISRELEFGELANWSDPEERENVLRELIGKIGAKPVKIKKRLFFKDPTIQYGNPASAKKNLLSLAKRMRKDAGSDYIVLAKSLPPFLRTLHRFMQHRVWEKDYNIAEQAKIERCLMLLWYVAMSTGISLEDLEQQMDKIIDQWKDVKS